MLLITGMVREIFNFKCGIILLQKYYVYQTLAFFPLVRHEYQLVDCSHI